MLQGALVRTMKAEGKSKAELKPMIDVLLDLKKQLTETKASFEGQLNGEVGNGDNRVDSTIVAELEEHVAVQVRLMSDINFK